MKKENKTLKNCSFGKKSLKKAIGEEKNIEKYVFKQLGNVCHGVMVK